MSDGYFKFEKLEVWKDAREFASLIYKITSGFPAKEKFGLIDQLRRAAVSIALNIAEGSTRGSDPDFRRFLKMAQGSVNEVVTGKEFDRVYEYSSKLNSRLNALIKSISR
jgi:four helix bundle protein